VQRHAKASWARAAPLGLAAAALLGSAPVAAQSDDEPAVALDRLLKLPESAPVEGSLEKRSGSTRNEWQARYREARGDLKQANAQLEETRAAIEKRAGEESGQWQMSAPGLGGAAAASPTDSPLDYKLTQELRRNREEVERAERALQDLDVEANLAGVPPDWRAAD